MLIFYIGGGGGGGISSQIKIKSMCDGWCVWPSLIRFLSGSSHSSEQLEEVSILLCTIHWLSCYMFVVTIL